LDWLGFGLALAWLWIGFGLDLDWIGFGLVKIPNKLKPLITKYYLYFSDIF
jgi:hypothetical protein